MEEAPAAMRETKRAARISKDGKWRSFVKFPNLLQYINTQTYYARIKVSGKLIRQSLNTDVWSNARLRLADFIGEKTRTRTSENVPTFADALELYREMASD